MGWVLQYSTVPSLRLSKCAVLSFVCRVCIITGAEVTVGKITIGLHGGESAGRQASCHFDGLQGDLSCVGLAG
eukprot:COSAG06_NODE_2322_length_7086_cov_9.273937_5_plen_73_part_00